MATVASAYTSEWAEPGDPEPAPDPKAYLRPSGTRFGELFAALAAPFDQQDLIEVPIGRDLYGWQVDERAVRRRLNEVLGPENWKDRFYSVANGSGLGCEITIILPDGTTCSREDGAGSRGMTTKDRDGTFHADPHSDVKAMFTDARRRAAVGLGIGEYLYHIPPHRKDGSGNGYTSANRNGNGHAPANSNRSDFPPANANGHAPQNGGGQSWGMPSSGKGLFRWAKEREEEHGTGLIDHLNVWAKQTHGTDARMVDWSPNLVQNAYHEACRKLGLQPQQDQPQSAEVPAKSFAGPMAAPDPDGEIKGKRMAVWAQCRQLTKHAQGTQANPADSPHPQEIGAKLNELLVELGYQAVTNVNQINNIHALRAVEAKAREQLEIVASFASNPPFRS